jgi:mercuric ion binding protein
MKKAILATVALSTVLFISCNSGSSGKNNQTANNETEHVHSHHATADGAHDEHALLNVKGSCEMCKERIEKTVSEIEGVSLASWDGEKQVLHLHYNPDMTSTDDIEKALAKVGHDTDNYKAEDAIYDALPGCCKYRTL